MKQSAAAVGLALICAITSVEPAHAVGTAKSTVKPPATHTGQWYTTPEGCSYSRAKAPGYPETWHLILNPHHIGKPAAKKSCPATL